MRRRGEYFTPATIPNCSGFYPVIGSWVVSQTARGMGIRENAGRITGNFSRFAPHLFR